jgi:hypothetical protein
VISGEPIVALALNLIVDLLGAVPTIIKTWYQPDSEDLLAWLLFLAANGLNLLAIDAWSASRALYPVYLFAVSVVVMGEILRAPGRMSKLLTAGSAPPD